MVLLNYFFSMTKAYWGSIGFGLLFTIALIALLVLEKEKIKRYIIVWYTLFVLVFIYNPITLMVCKKLLEPTTFDQYYLRFFSLIPVMAVIAYMFTIVLKRFTGVKKLAGVVVVCALIALLGNCIYTEDWFTKAENRNKVPQDVVTLCDLFADDDSDVIRIMAPQDIAVYLRQMESKFSMPYSRSLPDEAYELTNENPDPSEIVRYAKENNVSYVVVSAVDNVLNTYLNYGFKLYGRTANYAVLTPYEPTWILTEYPMASGDQGMCYTMENVSDGTLIVIDGGDAANEQTVRDAINERGGTVDAWIITHYHQDHVDSFNAIYADPQGIEIKDVYVTPLDADKFYQVAQEWDDVDSFDTFLEITKDAENINYVSRDDVLTFDDLTITFFNAYDQVVVDCKEDIPNNDSLVFKMATKERSVLICGDCHSRYMADYLVNTYKDMLQADILQCGHHGNNSMPEDTGFYETVNPGVAIFDTPDKIMTSPNYTAGALAAYLQQLNIRIVWYKSAPNVFGL